MKNEIVMRLDNMLEWDLSEKTTIILVFTDCGLKYYLLFSHVVSLAQVRAMCV